MSMLATLHSTLARHRWLLKLGAFLVLLDVVSGICALLGGVLYAIYRLAFAGG